MKERTKTSQKSYANLVTLPEFMIICILESWHYWLLIVFVLLETIKLNLFNYSNSMEKLRVEFSFINGAITNFTFLNCYFLFIISQTKVWPLLLCLVNRLPETEQYSVSVSRLEERELELKKEYNSLHQRHTEVRTGRKDGGRICNH